MQRTAPSGAKHARALAQRLCLAVLVTPCLVLYGSIAQNAPRALLNNLVGHWLMTGTVLHKPVQYRAQAKWVLQDQFLSLHMVDTAANPTYEANLFIGLDSAKQQYVAHWLDVFGGAGARVFGSGPFSQDSIVIQYPYEEGNFRNFFRYSRSSGLWTLHLDSQDKNGVWREFARYSFTRL